MRFLIISLFASALFVFCAPTPASAFFWGKSTFEITKNSTEADEFVDLWKSFEEDLSRENQKLLRHALVRAAFPRSKTLEDHRQAVDGYSTVDSAVEFDTFYSYISEFNEQTYYDIGGTIIYDAVARKKINGKTPQEIITAFEASEKAYLIPQYKYAMDAKKKVLEKQELLRNQIGLPSLDNSATMRKALSEIKISDVELYFKKHVYSSSLTELKPDSISFNIKNNSDTAIDKIKFEILVDKGDETIIEDTIISNINGELAQGKDKRVTYDVADESWAQINKLLITPGRTQGMPDMEKIEGAINLYRLGDYVARIELEDIEGEESGWLSMETLSQAAATRTRARGQNFRHKMALNETELELEALDTVINAFEKDLSLIGINPKSLVTPESKNQDENKVQDKG